MSSGPLISEFKEYISHGSGDDIFKCSCCSSPEKEAKSGEKQQQLCDCEKLHQAITSGIKRDVKLAARVGIDLVDQLQQMDMKMAAQKSNFAVQLARMEEENQLLLQQNRELGQSANASRRALTSSHERIALLTAELERVKTHTAQLKSYVKLADTLEGQIEALESMQANMTTELDAANRSRGVYERRWRAAEKMVMQMALSYDQLEASLPQNLRQNSAELGLARARLEQAQGLLLQSNGSSELTHSSGSMSRLLSHYSQPNIALSAGLATPDVSHVAQTSEDRPARALQLPTHPEDTPARLSDLSNILAGLDSKDEIEEYSGFDEVIEKIAPPMLRRSQSHESVLSVVTPVPPSHRLQRKLSTAYMDRSAVVPRFTNEARIASADISRELGAGIVNRSRDTAAQNMRHLLELQRSSGKTSRPHTESSMRNWLSFGRT